MITLIKGGTGSGKSVRLIKVANEEGETGKKVLIITLFSLELPGLIFRDNVIVALSSDIKLKELIKNADVIMIDDSYHVFKHEQVDLGELQRLEKKVYYTAQDLLPNMVYDNIIEVNWKPTPVKLYDANDKVFPNSSEEDRIKAYFVKTISGNNYMFLSEANIDIANYENRNLLCFNRTIDSNKIPSQRIDQNAKFELIVIDEETLIPMSSIEFIKIYNIYKSRLIY